MHVGTGRVSVSCFYFHIFYFLCLARGYGRLLPASRYRSRRDGRLPCCVRGGLCQTYMCSDDSVPVIRA